MAQRDIVIEEETVSLDGRDTGPLSPKFINGNVKCRFDLAGLARVFGLYTRPASVEHQRKQDYLKQNSKQPALRSRGNGLMLLQTSSQPTPRMNELTWCQVPSRCQYFSAISFFSPLLRVNLNEKARLNFERDELGRRN